MSILLNHLPSLQEGHEAEREKFFQQGLPFYTCLNGLDNLWQKEMPDGSTFHVILTYDWEKDTHVEKITKTLK